jgi:site-specific recombinase XerD
MELQYDKESFLDRVYRKSKSRESRNSAKTSLAAFDKFCLEKFLRSSEAVVQNMKKGEHDAYRVIDEFVSYLDRQHVSGSTIHTYISWVRNYMVYCDVDIQESKFKMKVNMPKILKDKGTPLSVEMVNRVYYNYLRPHSALNGKTPAEEAGIDLNLEGNKWQDLIKKGALSKRKEQ